MPLRFPHTGTHNSCVFLTCDEVKSFMCCGSFSSQFTEFLFIPDGYSRRFVFKAPMVWNPFCTKVLIIFQKHTSSHKGNKTLLVEQAVPLQYFVQYQSWKLIYCTLQKHSSGQCRYRKA